NWLWALNPYTPTSQIIGRLDNGTFTSSAIDGSTRRPYRCVCPSSNPTNFSGDACYGPAGSECFTGTTEGKRINVDKFDRAAISKGAAMWECAFNNAHLWQYGTAIEAIQAGLPNGSTSWLHTADDGRYEQNTLIKWLNVQLSFTPDGNTTISTMTDFRPFRCAGTNYDSGTHPNTVTDAYKNSRNGYTIDGRDNPALNWAAAHDACWAKGGHLARTAELGEVIQQGLGNGTNNWLWTHDQHGWNGTQMLTGLARWSGTQPNWGHYYSDFVTWAYKTDGGYAYRCVYYPIDRSYQGPATSDCNGGCTKFTMPGATPATYWVDTFERVPANLGSAVNICMSRGGHVMTNREYLELVRKGLPNGTGQWVHGLDYGYGTSGHYTMIIRWTGTDVNYNDQYSTYMTHTGMSATHPYRCYWSNELR
ncbi:MAG: hypothetical protein ACK4N5_18185, partial [Myxococcales bacterium]